MDLTLYRRPDGAYVLVPECLVASRTAQREHGPLVPVARVHAALEHDDPVARRVLDDIDRQSFAVVRRETGEDLLQRVEVAA